MKKKKKIFTTGDLPSRVIKPKKRTKKDPVVFGVVTKRGRNDDPHKKIVEGEAYGRKMKRKFDESFPVLDGERVKVPTMGLGDLPLEE